MPIAIYPALMRRTGDAGLEAALVDFPDARVAGANSAELVTGARRQLGELLAELDAGGRDWPTPTPVDELLARQQAEGAALLMVDVQVEDAPVRVNISLGERLLRRLDEAAEAHNMTRSAYIAAAVRQRLGEPASGGGAGSQRLYEEVSELRRKVNEALGPDSAFGRTVADLDARALDGLRQLADRWGVGARRRD